MKKFNSVKKGNSVQISVTPFFWLYLLETALHSANQNQETFFMWMIRQG